MENKLKNMFDYQKFEKNSRLEKLISDTESRYARELTDDDLVMVNAAGEFGMAGEETGKNEDETAWYNIENKARPFKPGSRFDIKWISEESQK